ncbi:MAG: hypothetical protein HKN15_06265 [Xanthomonadales bacterium]|nr:hypothetical protein [Xanthomonadales bacterium]
MLLAGDSAFAQFNHAAFTGSFNGSEPTAAGIIDQGFLCDNPVNLLGYKTFGPFQVSASGTYYISDPGERAARPHPKENPQVTPDPEFDALNAGNWVDVATGVFQDSFNPNEVSENIVGGHNEGGQLFLNADTNYILVVQESCERQVGDFYVVIRGFGTVTGSGFVELPAYTFDDFGLLDPRADLGDGELEYDNSGPLQFPDGTLLYSDAGAFYQSNMKLRVYEGAFDPAQPNLNKIAEFDEVGQFNVESEKTYFLVAQPINALNSGAIYAYVIQGGSTGISINAGLNDAWVSTEAPFQGMFFTVFEALEAIFLAWFTFDSIVPAGPDTATFGAFDQRWVTALGGWEGNLATLTAELTTGGIFNGSDPLGSQTPNYGTITIEFISCNEALVTYDFPSIGLSGSFTATRVLDDNVALCEAMQ